MRLAIWFIFFGHWLSVIFNGFLNDQMPDRNLKIGSKVTHRHGATNVHERPSVRPIDRLHKMHALETWLDSQFHKHFKQQNESQSHYPAISFRPQFISIGLQYLPLEQIPYHFQINSFSITGCSARFSYIFIYIYSAFKLKLIHEHCIGKAVRKKEGNVLRNAREKQAKKRIQKERIQKRKK